MMKKSLFVKAYTCLFATVAVAGIYSCSSVDSKPKRIDFSAFKNASANIQFLAQSPMQKDAVKVNDVNADIVRVIEKEVRGKISTTRVAVAPKKIISPKEVIAKNWNDIRPNLDAVEMKIDQALLSKITANEEISEFEINNRELIKLSGFSMEVVSFNSFGQVALESFESSEVKEDVVATAQASTIMTVQDEVAPIESAAPAPEAAPAVADLPDTGDDLVVFDYSEKNPEEVKSKKMFDAPISKSVKEAIEREVHKGPAVAFNPVAQKKRVTTQTTADLETLEKAMTDEDNLVFDYSNQSQAALAKTESKEKSDASAFTAGFTDTTTQAQFTIKVSEVNLSTRKVQPAGGFEFVPDYDRAERLDDQTTGEIKLRYSLAGDVNTQTGVLQSHGMIPTRVELNLLEGGMNAPMLNEEGVQKFLKNKQADVVGNLLMVAVDPSIVDVEIDSDYAYKLYFNNKFKMLESKENASYMLFLGVKTGNIVIRYLLDNKESAQKIVYVGDGEMYFEDPDFVNTQRELYTFTTRSLLGKKVKELNIDGSNISFYGTNVTAKKKALNAYEIKVPEHVNNSRKYLEFKHMGTSLFVGTQKTTEMEIPGRDFIGRVLQANDLNELGSRCMVQINLTKDLRDIKVGGKNMSGEMFAETSFLDSDGNFSRDNSELSEKVFVTGDLEGIFSVRLDYTDGSTDFLKTFCSQGSYLVEQL